VGPLDAVEEVRAGCGVGLGARAGAEPEATVVDRVPPPLAITRAVEEERSAGPKHRDCGGADVDADEVSTVRPIVRTGVTVSGRASAGAGISAGAGATLGLNAGAGGAGGGV
jgi:hypothetical protein